VPLQPRRLIIAPAAAGCKRMLARHFSFVIQMRDVLDEVLADLKHISVRKQPAIALARTIAVQTHSIGRTCEELSV
jgi:hypothetical protein